MPPLQKEYTCVPSNYMLASVLDKLNFGVVLTDSKTCVLHHNEYAKKIVGSNTGLMSAIGAPLKTRSENETLRLQEFITKAASGADEGRERSHHFAMTLGEGAGAGLEFLVISGLSRDGLSGNTREAGAVVFVTRSEANNTVPENMLRSLFGLTVSEANLTTYFLESKVLAVAAGRSSIGINTARTHLKRIFAKTQTSRQAELVALILKTVGFLKF